MHSNVIDIDAKAAEACALINDGSVKCWYGNYDVSNGFSSYSYYYSDFMPKVISGVSDVIKVHVGGRNICVLTTASLVKCWGADYGATPVTISGLDNDIITIGIDGDNYVCILTSIGAVKCLIPSLNPPLTTRFSNGATAFDSDRVTCAIINAGAQCYGYGENRQLGDGTDTYYTASPVQVSGLTNSVSAVSTSGNFACALSSSGAVKCWGRIGGIIVNTTPATMAGLENGIASIGAGDSDLCAVTNNGGLKCLGDNYGSNVAINITELPPIPASVYGSTPPPHAEVGIVGTDTPDPATAGGLLTYTLSVSNTYNLIATAVSITDALPSGFSLLSANVITPGGTGTCTAAALVSGCPMGDLVGLGRITMTIVGIAPQISSVITNTAGVASGLDLNPNNNFASITTTLNFPILNINDVTQIEGNNGSSLMVFTVASNIAISLPITITANSNNGSATAGSDFTSIVAKQIVIPANKTSQLITVTMQGDTDIESTETFELILSNPEGAFIVDSVGLGTITNDDVSTLLVTNVNDSGAGSLRDAIATANTNGGGTIQFNLGAGAHTIILNSGALLIDQNINIQGPNNGTLTVSGNNASQVFITNANVQMSNLIIAKGQGFFGGGINQGSGTLVLNNVTLNENVASYGGGGGILQVDGTLTLNNVTLSNNTSAFGGGAIRQIAGAMTLNNVTLNGNAAGSYGGGIYQNDGTGAITLNNATLSGNSSGSYGGGIMQEGGLMTLTHVTLSDNSANSGGGIYPVNIVVSNTIIANNIGGDCQGGLTQANYVIIKDSFANACGLSTSGTVRAGTDPLLGPLANNGGTTLTHLPQANSPAKDTGSCVLPFDQRGIARPQGAACDIGAVEVAAAPVVAPPYNLNIRLNSSGANTPTRFNAYANRPIELALAVKNATNFGAFSYKFNWTPAVRASAQTVAIGTFPGSTSRSFARPAQTPPLPLIDNASGFVRDAWFSTGQTPVGANGDGNIALVTLMPLSAGETALTLSEVVLAQINGAVISGDLYNATMMVRASCMGDFDTNDKIEINDVQTVAHRYGTLTGNPLYDLFYDLDNDGDVDVGDIQRVANRWGKTCAQLPNDRLDSSPASNAARSRMATSPTAAKAQPSPDGKTLNIDVQNLDHVGAFEIEMLFDPKSSSISGVELGDILQGGPRQWVTVPLRNTGNKITFGAVSLGNNTPALSGTGNLAKIKLAALGKAPAATQVLKITLLDIEGNVLTTIMPNQSATK